MEIAEEVLEEEKTISEEEALEEIPVVEPEVDETIEVQEDHDELQFQKNQIKTKTHNFDRSNPYFFY